jgi:hypothetical protein
VTLSYPTSQSLRLSWPSGSTLDFHHIFLRHNCACACVPACVHPTTGEPIVDPALIDPAIQPLSASIVVDGDTVESSSVDTRFVLAVTWSDQHSSVYTSSWSRRGRVG